MLACAHSHAIYYTCVLKLHKKRYIIHDFKKILNGFSFFLVGIPHTYRSALQVCFVFNRDQGEKLIILSTSSLVLHGTVSETLLNRSEF